MKKKHSFFLLLLIFCAKSGNANGPSFNCSKASGIVENTICQDMVLSELDVVLSKVYAKSIELTKTPGKMKKQQIEWLKSRPRKDSDLTMALQWSYEKRIQFLLKEKMLLPYFLNEIMDGKVSSHLLSYAILALQEKQIGKPVLDAYNLPKDLKYSFFMPIAADRGIAFLCTSAGAYRENYAIFEVTREKNEFVINALKLPYPDNKFSTGLSGNISIDTVNKRISFSTRSASYDAGDQYEWDVKDKIPVLVKYKLSKDT